MKDAAPNPLPLRAPETVLRLSRMGVSMPTRLSFLRAVVRRLCQERATVTRPHWDMCAEGYGTAVHQVRLGGHDYALVSVSRPLADADRSDRVIATAWDAAFVLFDGVPGPGDIARIAENAPLQEAGRFGPRDLVLSRANKSVRLWAEIVAALRAGRQPDPARIIEIGYLMRTTAVYGNGKFGIADRHVLAGRDGMEVPFAAEMLTVYLIRQFTLDLVQHVGGAPLDAALARHLGVGNATGLGMAPFLVTHPVLLNNWMAARETALARVLAQDSASDEVQARASVLARRALDHLGQWHVPSKEDDAALRALGAEWAAFLPAFGRLGGDAPFAALWDRAQDRSEALQELLAALLIELFPEEVDGLTDCMADPIGALPRPFAGTGALRAAIARDWAWALEIDFDAPEAARRFWYVSADKLEPRLGDRFAEHGAEMESPLDIARRVQRLAADLPDTERRVSAFLRDFPRHAMAVERVATLAAHPYAEIRDNLIAATCRPIDMLRCKLSFFGATKFDPKSDLWTRITLAQGAPLGDALTPEGDDWWLPSL
ncbi:MAG: hypothetical protein AAGL96_00705 [Pseudomonadota bacterium]